MPSGQKIYWIEGPWKGRLAIVPRPRGGDWLDDEIRNWKESGLEVVVSLLTAPEEHELSLTEEAQACQKHGLQHLSFPILDLGVPSSLSATLTFVEGLGKALSEGKTVAIHCRQGIGRSGMISACVLVRSGLKSAEASQVVSDARGCLVPETHEQHDWLIGFARGLRPAPSLSFNMAIREITALIKSGQASARTRVETSVAAAERLNDTLNAFVEIDRPGALKRAEELDQRNKTGADSGPLAGVPIAIKDNICVRGLQASCGSHILGDYHPPYNATVIERLLEAGAVIIGKTNCDEFAMGSSNENSAFGPVKNPWDVSRVPGGSSGGSAAAVAAGIVPVALGSDTGGSVRQPASMCGVVGLKPTYGRNSRYGLVAFASSLDQVGVFARNVTDIATVLRVIAGRDPHDATTADVVVPDYTSALTGDIKGTRIGFSRALFGKGLDREVATVVEQAVDDYRRLGAEVVEIELPHAQYAIAVYYIIATAEASSNLARFDGVRYGFRAEEAPKLRQMYRKTREEGFGPEVKRRIMLGTYVLSAGYYDAYYRKAQQVRSLIKADFRRAFERCDAIVTPTSPTPAFAIGEKVDDPLAMYLNDIYTVTANLVGVPGISIPSGLSSRRLPIGMQLLGPYWSEPALLNLAYAFEQLRPFNEQPPVFAR